jgi:hypothetical protein
MSVNRPRLLMRALRSLKRHTIALHESRIFRFQDGAQSRFIQVPLDSSLQESAAGNESFHPSAWRYPSHLISHSADL